MGYVTLFFYFSGSREKRPSFGPERMEALEETMGRNIAVTKVRIPLANQPSQSVAAEASNVHRINSVPSLIRDLTHLRSHGKYVSSTAVVRREVLRIGCK